MPVSILSVVRATCAQRNGSALRPAPRRCLGVVMVLLSARAGILPALAADSVVAKSAGLYRLPFASGTHVKVFDDFTTHRPRGRVDLYAVDGNEPYAVVAAAAGRVVAIQDGFSDQQSGRPAAQCHNNYVWIAHANGEWSNYSHLAYHSVTQKAHLQVGDAVTAGQYLGDEAAVGCAMLDHVHFEVAIPATSEPLDAGGFLTENDDGMRERNPRFCDVPGELATKGDTYVASACAPQRSRVETR
jgi:murein DD-endopeptidase MepM/ murein hydrolase activator NlpD